MDPRKECKMKYDYLIGNLNRMCVTDDAEELENMYNYAKKRLDSIYTLNKERLEDIAKIRESHSRLMRGGVRVD